MPPQNWIPYGPSVSCSVVQRLCAILLSTKSTPPQGLRDPCSSSYASHFPFSLTFQTLQAVNLAFPQYPTGVRYDLKMRTKRYTRTYVSCLGLGILEVGDPSSSYCAFAKAVKAAVVVIHLLLSKIFAMFKVLHDSVATFSE